MKQKLPPYIYNTYTKLNIQFAESVSPLTMQLCVLSIEGGKRVAFNKNLELCPKK